MDEHAWQHKSRAILTDITAWRQAHPKATFVEIEDEVHRRLMELEAPVLQDAAQASASREWDHTSGLARCVRRVAFLGVQISAETARRLTERMGACVEAAHS